MEPITIATSILTILMPFIKKSTEEFAGEAGKAVFEKTKNLFATLKAKMSIDNIATDMLERFEQKPDVYQPAVVDILEEKITEDRALADELRGYLEDIKKSGPQVKVVIEMEKAENLIVAKIRKMSKGNLEARANIKEGKDVTGVEIDEM